MILLSFARLISLVPSVFLLSPAEKPRTSLIKIVEDVDADTNKSSAKFELKMLSPSPTTVMVRDVRPGHVDNSFATEELSPVLQSNLTKEEKG